MKYRRAFSLLGLTVAAGFLSLSISQTVTLRASVVGAGGGTSGDATYRLAGTVAQAAVGFAQNTERMVGVGFWYPSLGFVTSLGSTGDGLPTDFRLEQNFPNPFNPGTQLRFEVPVASDVRLVVFDLLGRRVATVAAGQSLPGRYSVPFVASHLASGVYLYRLEAVSERGLFVDVKKMVLVK